MVSDFMMCTVEDIFLFIDIQFVDKLQITNN